MAAPQPADQREIVVRLDPLGGRLHVERARKPDDRRDDRRVHAVLVGRPQDEALVDLDLVERRLLQIAERRIARSEIVERQPHAEIGRASCRERVWQYVEISVVAVSLKKKNNKIIY